LLEDGSWMLEEKTPNSLIPTSIAQLKHFQ